MWSLLVSFQWAGSAQRRRGASAPVGVKVLVLLMVGVVLGGGMVGCGANPGGDFLGGDVGDIGLPVNGVSEKIQVAYQYLSSGSLTAARGAFLEVLSDNPSQAERAQALAGIGFVDTRLYGSSEGMAEFEQAYQADSSNPEARVGLAGALISRGASDDVARAVELLEGLDPGNPNFVYQDRFNLGISNAEVHALLAYAYRIKGDLSNSQQQADIARSLDASVDDSTVDQILAVLAFIP